MNYDWTVRFKAIHDYATLQYGAGLRDLESFFSAEQKVFLASIGMRPMELFDFVEDLAKAGEPDFGTALLITAERRDYFLTEQNGVWSNEVINMDALPAKDAASEGIVWLPRIIPKARAKLRGEMPNELMYGCGGDRRFFRENKIHPADFLRTVRRAGANDAAIIAYVQASRQSSS